MTGDKPQKPAKLLMEHVDLFHRARTELPVLDLACGTGRNGLELASRGIEVVFADRSADALKVVAQRLAERQLPGTPWQVDLEQAAAEPLKGRRFSAIIVFRYLHRPLFSPLLRAVEPGGLVIYETFTTANRRFGRPENPDFLLKAGELREIFRDWHCIHSFEGVKTNPDRAIAQIVARKPGRP